MTKNELQQRVNARKLELETEHSKLAEFKEKVSDFIGDIKSRSVIYTLVKNLPLWKKLEELTD